MTRLAEMTRLDPELEALLEQGKIIRRLPASVRSRAIARARAAMAAAAPAPAGAPVTPARGRRLWLALAASVCVAAGGAGVATALLGRAPHRPESAPAWSPPAVRPARINAPVVPAAAPAPTVIAPQPTSITTPRRPARPATAQESYAAELKLLKRAQAAYANQDFSGALSVVSEHARQFPKGRLAEEREALRVRSLASSGLTVEARRAVAMFAERFPRSALLPRLREGLGVKE